MKPGQNAPKRARQNASSVRRSPDDELDDVHQIGNLDWFLRLGVELLVIGDVMPGHEDTACRGSLTPQSIGKDAPAHVGKDEIAEDDVDRLRRARAERVTAPTDRADPRSVELEHHQEQLACVFVVVDHEHVESAKRCLRAGHTIQVPSFDAGATQSRCGAGDCSSHYGITFDSPSAEPI
ncbi:hypothetical protein BH09MYX1_BH09MYX1_60720 [soil metagenome]